MNRAPLTERCAGKWGSILQAIGISKSFLSGRHSPCPLCGGRDRFRWINRNGSGDWHCNQCLHGSGMDLAKLFLKCDFKTAAERIEAALGSASVDRVKKETDPRAARAASRRLWQSTQEITGVGLIYLEHRGVMIPPPTVMRFMPECRYDRETAYPALIAKIVDAQGHGVNLQKTYIARDGRGKAPVEKPYQMMAGTLPPGSAIRLFEPHTVLAIAEGWTTALSAYALFGIPCWSVLSATGIRKFTIPEEIEELLIFADADKNYTGQAAAYDRANRAVVQDGIRANVYTPPEMGTDYNDVLLLQKWPLGHCTVEFRKPSFRDQRMRVIECSDGREVLA